VGKIEFLGQLGAYLPGITVRCSHSAEDQVEFPIFRMPMPSTYDVARVSLAENRGSERSTARSAPRAKASQSTSSLILGPSLQR